MEKGKYTNSCFAGLNDYRLELLQACRALAFGGIFLSHVTDVWSGAWGVSIFFVLSGFLTVYKDSLKKEDSIVSLRGSFRYVWQKISKLYVLHILMFIPALAISLYLQISGIDQKNWGGLAYKAVLNLLLVQSWFPDEKIYFSFNGVSWFLSSCTFIWFVTPSWLRFVRKADCKRCVCRLAGIVLVMMCMSFFIENYTGLTEEMKKWFAYIFPPVRFLDFSGGGLLGKLFLEYKTWENNGSENEWKWNVLGAVFIIWSIIMLILAQDRLPISLSVSAIWFPGSLALIWIAANEKGMLARLLKAPLLIRLGDISQYLFLIHQIIIRYVNEILSRVIDRQRFVLLFAIAEFAVSVFSAIMIEKYMPRYRETKALRIHRKKP